MPDRGLILLLFILILAAPVFLRPSIHGTDGVCNYVFTRSLLYDGDLDFTNEYAAFQARRNYDFPFSRGIVSPETGRPDNSYGPGSAILWTPFVLAARGWLGVSAQRELDDGYSRPFEQAVGWGTVFWVSLGLVLVYLFLRMQSIGEGPALVGVLAVWALTPLFFYTYLHPSMSHGPSFFISALTLFMLGRRRRWVWDWLGIGACLGFMILIRMQDLPLTACLAVLAVIQIKQDHFSHQNSPETRRKWILSLFCLVLGVLLLLLPLLAVWSALYGGFWEGPRNYLGQDRYPFPRYFFHVWFSSFHGLLYWHPVLTVALGGLLWRHAGNSPHLPQFQKLGLAALFAQTLLIGSWWSWYGGASFGHRMFVSCLPFFAMGFAIMLSKAAAWADSQTPGYRRALWIGTGAAFLAALYWNLGLAWLYGNNFIPREEPVSWAQMLEGLLIELPRSVF